MDNGNVTRHWQLLVDASQSLRDCATLLCKEELDKVTLAQEKIFKVVFKHPEGLKLKDIANELRLTPGAVSQSVEGLVREGMLERVTNPDDRRAVKIRATAKSDRYRRVNYENFSRIMSAVLEECSEAESRAFVRVTEKIIEKAGAFRAEIQSTNAALAATEETA